MREFGSPSSEFDIPSLRPKDMELYGLKPIEKQWMFEPADSPVSYCLQLMADGTYHKLLAPKNKENRSE